jgi:hypothetical protein
MLNLADRIKETLKRAQLNVRALSAVTELHYTTIYIIIRKGEDAKPYKMVSNILINALDTIDKLIEDKLLPLQEGLTQDTKNETLKTMFAKYQ